MAYENITYFIIDVDGTLTDGSIYYDEKGNEYKKFNTKDAVAFWAAQAVGIEMIIITGRMSKALERRAKDLKVKYLFQGVRNKTEKIVELMDKLNFSKTNLGYVGDDLNDYPAMIALADFIACPYDACDEIKEIAHYVAKKSGGYGAVREIMTYLIKQQNKWEDALEKIEHKYGMGRAF